MSEILEDVVRLYEAYLEEFYRQKKGHRPFDGIFGFGTGPQDYPCHEKFIHDLDRQLKSLLSRPPAPHEAGEVLRYIYCGAPERWEAESTVYWMLLAAHSLTPELIGCLDAPGAQALYDEYRNRYPRRRRLPVQDKILGALKERAKAE